MGATVGCRILMFCALTSGVVSKNSTVSDNDASSMIEDVAETSSWVGAIIAVAVACCCVLPIMCKWAFVDEDPDPKEGFSECKKYPIALGLFTYNLYSFVLCWGVYNALSGVDGVPTWLLHTVFVLAVIPSLFALVGFFVGIDYVYNERHLGSVNHIAVNTTMTIGVGGTLILASPWAPILNLKDNCGKNGQLGDLNTMDATSVKIFHFIWLLIHFPMGIICIYVLAQYGFNWACFLKAVMEISGILTFWVLRYTISTPPYGPCGCLTAPKEAYSNMIISWDGVANDDPQLAAQKKVQEEMREKASAVVQRV